MSDDYVKNAMNLNTPNERRVTHHVFEQTYFTKDAIAGNSNYTFQFPETWAGLPTKKKAVGFRYAKRKVNSYYIMFEFKLRATYQSEIGTTVITTEYPKSSTANPACMSISRLSSTAEYSSLLSVTVIGVKSI